MWQSNKVQAKHKTPAMHAVKNGLSICNKMLEIKWQIKLVGIITSEYFAVQL